MNEAFKALADQTRRDILRLLRGGEMSAGDLARHFEQKMTKPSMSYHFSVLKQAGLIDSRREGQKIIYVLNTTATEDLLAIIWDLFSRGEAGSDKGGST